MHCYCRVLHSTSSRLFSLCQQWQTLGSAPDRACRNLMTWSRSSWPGSRGKCGCSRRGHLQRCHRPRHSRHHDLCSTNQRTNRALPCSCTRYQVSEHRRNSPARSSCRTRGTRWTGAFLAGEELANIACVWRKRLHVIHEEAYYYGKSPFDCQALTCVTAL